MLGLVFHIIGLWVPRTNIATKISSNISGLTFLELIVLLQRKTVKENLKVERKHKKLKKRDCRMEGRH